MQQALLQQQQQALLLQQQQQMAAAMAGQGMMAPGFGMGFNPMMQQTTAAVPSPSPSVSCGASGVMGPTAMPVPNGSGIMVPGPFGAAPPPQTLGASASVGTQAMAMQQALLMQQMQQQIAQFNAMQQQQQQQMMQAINLQAMGMQQQQQQQFPGSNASWDIPALSMDTHQQGMVNGGAPQAQQQSQMLQSLFATSEQPQQQGSDSFMQQYTQMQQQQLTPSV